MSRLLVILIPLAISIYALIDAITTPKSQVRGMPKMVWVILIILTWIGGAVLWFFLGRPRSGSSGWRPGGGSEIGRPQGPDDDPDFLAKLNRNKPKSDT